MLGVNQENEKMMEEYERLASEVKHDLKFHYLYIIYISYDSMMMTLCLMKPLIL